MTSHELITSLKGIECPACGRKKKTRMSFCGGCYFKLPNAVRTNLYNLVGHGYEEAMASALKILAGGDEGEDEHTRQINNPADTGQLFGGAS